MVRYARVALTIGSNGRGAVVVLQHLFARHCFGRRRWQPPNKCWHSLEQGPSLGINDWMLEYMFTSQKSELMLQKLCTNIYASVCISHLIMLTPLVESGGSSFFLINVQHPVLGYIPSNPIPAPAMSTTKWTIRNGLSSCPVCWVDLDSINTQKYPKILTP
jgi:hypothetical protein